MHLSSLHLYLAAGERAHDGAVPAGPGLGHALHQHVLPVGHAGLLHLHRQGQRLRAWTRGHRQRLREWSLKAEFQERIYITGHGEVGPLRPDFNCERFLQSQGPGPQLWIRTVDLNL